MINHIAGLPVHILDDSHIFVEPGTASLWRVISGSWDIDIVAFQAIYSIDMNSIGLNGRDAGSFSNGCYYVYALYNPTTEARGFIASKQINIRDVVVPSGFTSWRKLMYGVTVIAGRCVPVHAGGWPQPTIMFTENDPAMVVASIGSPSQRDHWVPVNLAALIPENSRLGIFSGRIAGGVGSIWISPSSVVPNPYFKTLLENQVGVCGDVACRVDGSQVVNVWVGGSGTAELILRGFSMTETS